MNSIWKKRDYYWKEVLDRSVKVLKLAYAAPDGGIKRCKRKGPLQALHFLKHNVSAEFVKYFHQMFANHLRISSFDVMALHKVHQFTVFE